MAAGDSERVKEAQKLAKTDSKKAEALYREITSKAPSAGSDAATREYETALVGLGELYRDEKFVTQYSKAHAWDGAIR
jgi:26S proteasome regulatory subunit N6